MVALGTDFSAKTSRNAPLRHGYAALQVDARVTFIGTRTIRFSKIGTRNNPEDCMTRVRPSLTSCVADEHRSGNGRSGGADRDRTDDLRLAKPALSQLSYSPENWSGYRQDPIVAAPPPWWA